MWCHNRFITVAHRAGTATITGMTVTAMSAAEATTSSRHKLMVRDTVRDMAKVMAKVMARFITGVKPLV